MPLSSTFIPCGFDDLPGWEQDAQEQAFVAFRRSAVYASEHRYRSGALGITFDALGKAFSAAANAEYSSKEAARQFFETHFVPCRMLPPDGGEGFVTSFYEPIAAASPVKTERYIYPVHAVPHDLIKVDDANHASNLDPGHAYARQGKCGLTAYYDRSEIEQGALDGRGLEIAWLADRVELFFIHVQGAARLKMTDGGQKRITFAAKSGHPFTSIGKVLIDLGALSAETVTMQSIKAWLAAHPERIDEILRRNRSYIFFREAPVEDPSLGPVAAAKVPLTAGRSLAIDRLLHTFGTPFYIDAPEVTAFDGEPFRRLMVAQDTGSAIVGPCRGDLFAGSGEAAGEIAGGIRHPAQFFALVPKSLFGRVTG